MQMVNGKNINYYPEEYKTGYTKEHEPWKRIRRGSGALLGLVWYIRQGINDIEKITALPLPF